MAKEKRKHKSPIIDEVGKRQPNKAYKPKKPKVDWRINRYGCPFCHSILPEVTPIHTEQFRKFSVWVMARRAKKCLVCNSRNRIGGCPACKRDTWYNKITGIYRHTSMYGCGFEGKKLIRAVGEMS